MLFLFKVLHREEYRVIEREREKDIQMQLQIKMKRREREGEIMKEIHREKKTINKKTRKREQSTTLERRDS